MATTVMFRPRRELLADAMTEARCVSSVAEIMAIMDDPRVKVIDKPFCFDDRVGWHTHMVVAGNFVVGYTNGALS